MKNKLSVNLEVSLVEIIVSILIFSICAVIMLNCFAAARYTQFKANDKSIALLKGQSVLEYIKAAKNSQELGSFLRGKYKEESGEGGSSIYSIYYDKDWNEAVEGSKEFFLKIRIYDEKIPQGSKKQVTVTVERCSQYPIIGKGTGSEMILSLSTKKFFPDEGVN